MLTLTEKIMPYQDITQFKLSTAVNPLELPSSQAAKKPSSESKKRLRCSKLEYEEHEGLPSTAKDSEKVY